MDEYLGGFDQWEETWGGFVPLGKSEYGDLLLYQVGEESRKNQRLTSTNKPSKSAGIPFLLGLGSTWVHSPGVVGLVFPSSEEISGRHLRVLDL